jgi:hypothetical protein
MRFLLIALMIALLPLRGWMGDVMATEMAASQGQASQIAARTMASHAHSAGESDHLHHGMTAPEAMQSTPDCLDHSADTTSHANCGSCPACQACHTVALSSAAQTLRPVFHPFTLPASAAAQFTSAEAALGQKPPIS